MKSTDLLITSFAPWKAHHRSNASDDLLLECLKRSLLDRYTVLRYLPVNLPIALSLTTAKIEQLHPQTIVCCGMAESRQKLSLEAKAIVHQQERTTSFDLERMTANLSMTEISQDAGRFVCNSLYYFVLDYLQTHHPARQALFVHVPVLTAANREAIVADFQVVLQRLSASIATVPVLANTY